MSGRRRSCRDSRSGENLSNSEQRSARRMPAMLTFGFCKARSRAFSSGLKKLMPLMVLPSHARGRGEAVERSHACRGVVEGGEVREVAAVGAEENPAQVDEAVDGFLDWGEAARRRALAMFHLAVVLEEGHVVGGGFDAQDDAELVVHLDDALAEAMLDAGAFDAGGELIADLLGQLRGDLAAEEGGNLLRLDAEHRLAGQLLVERRQR